MPTPPAHPTFNEHLEHLRAAVSAAAEALYGIREDQVIRFDRPPKIELGELAFGCFGLAKATRKSPALVAQELAAHLIAGDQTVGTVERMEAAGPYLNFRLTPQALFGGLLTEIDAAGGSYGHHKGGAGQKVMVEFSSPNTNKPLHLGHIRNNALGWSVSCLLEAAGYEVIRANLINDRGIHICKSMLAYAKWGAGTDPARENLKGDHLVGRFYVQFSRALKEEKDEMREEAGVRTGLKGEELDAWLETEAPLAKEAQQMLQAWEAGDPGVRALWSMMNSWVFNGFDVTYQRMGIHFDRIYRESETYTRGRGIVLDALERGLVYRNEDGSVWIDLDGDEKKILLRRDGTSLYFTQDLGTAVIKYEDCQPVRSIYVVGNEQDRHFQLLILSLKKLGYTWADGLYHLSYGMVNLPDGKMKSREGTVVDADDLMDELDAACLEKAQEALAQGAQAPADPQALAETARQVAQGALKFFILKVNPRKAMIFNPQESISLQGDTGPYVQYAHARIRSLLTRAAREGIHPADALARGWTAKLGHVEERAVAQALARFPEMVREAADKLAPSTITTYLLELSGAFNRFYNAHPVMKAEPELAAARLALCQQTATVLAEGLRLLGIPAPEVM